MNGKLIAKVVIAILLIAIFVLSLITTISPKILYGDKILEKGNKCKKDILFGFGVFGTIVSAVLMIPLIIW